MEGVIFADASFTAGKAVVKYEPKKVVPSQLVKAINAKTLYRASLASVDTRTKTEEVTDKGESIYAQILGVVKYGLWGLPVLLVSLFSWWWIRKPQT